MVGVGAAVTSEEPEDRDDREPMPEPEPQWIPCVGCRENLVCVTDGFDTCAECLRCC